MNLIKTLLVFIKKARRHWMNFKIPRIKVKIKWQNVNKLCQKISNISINTGLDLKTRFLWEKKKRKYNKIEISSILMQCSLKCGVVFLFASDNFQGTFVDLCFMILIKVLIKQLARFLIHVHKIFKILFSMCLTIVEKKL